MVDADVCGIAWRVIVGQRELLALFELDLSLGKLAETHLRPLRIKDQRDDLP